MLLAKELYVTKTIDGDQAGAQAVVNIVIIVGDLVGDIGYLRFKSGLLLV